jgi:hypothetical protein
MQVTRWQPGAHIISTHEMIEADDRAVARAYGKRVRGEVSPDCDRLFEYMILP